MWVKRIYSICTRKNGDRRRIRSDSPYIRVPFLTGISSDGTSYFGRKPTPRCIRARATIILRRPPPKYTPRTCILLAHDTHDPNTHTHTHCGDRVPFSSLALYANRVLIHGLCWAGVRVILVVV